ncbi:hypothetical protein [Exiguobacterium flavidum]|uniref:hypothetical protein n=1 Tax=Exiguobacterium flavidum TaxID=2184695 RepID=UPI000DF736AE|nr:hypothetical protein [Exiguobacterium flavidum]
MTRPLIKTISQIAIATTLFSVAPVNTLSADAYASVKTQTNLKVKVSTSSLQPLTLIGSKTIKLGKTTYNLSKAQASFFRQNKKVLKKARLSVTYDAKRNLKTIAFLELNTSGAKSVAGDTTYKKNTSFDGKGQKIDTIKVNGDYVTVKNVTVSKALRLASGAKSVTRLVGVNAAKISQDRPAKQLTKQAVSFPTLSIVKGKVSELDLSLANTRVQLSDRAAVQNMTASANINIQASPSVSIERVLVESNVTTFTLNASVGQLTSEAKALTLTGNATVGQFETTAENGKLSLQTTGEIKHVVLNGAGSTVSFSDKLEVPNITLVKSASVQSLRELPLLDIKGENTKATIEAPVGQLNVHAASALTLSSGATVSKVTAKEPVTVTGAGKLDQLVLSGNATSVQLDVQTKQVTVETTSDKAVAIKGKAEITELKLNTASDVQLALPKVGTVSEGSANKGKVDMGTTVVDTVKVDETKIVTPPAPPVTPPTPPVVIVPAPGPVDPVEVDPVDPDDSQEQPVQISAAMAQLKNLVSDRYKIFDMNKQTFTNLVEAGDIENYDEVNISQYRTYLGNVWELKSSEQVQHMIEMIRLVKTKSSEENYENLEKADIQTLEYQPGYSELPNLEVYIPNAIRYYRIQDGEIVATQEMSVQSSRVFNFAKETYGYMEWDSSMTKSVHLFEMNDGSLKKVTFDFSNENEDEYYTLERINGAPVPQNTATLEGHVKEIPIEDNARAARYVRYQVDGIDTGAMIAWAHTNKYTVYPYYDESSKSITFDIPVHWYQDREVGATILVPGFLPYTFKSERSFEKVDVPYMIMEKDARFDQELTYLNVLTGETTQIPLQVLNNHGEELSPTGMTIKSLHGQQELPDAEVKVVDGTLEVKTTAPGRGVYELQIGDYKQVFAINSEESLFGEGTINVNDVRDKERALEYVYRAYLLHDSRNLPFSIFELINESFSPEFLSIYRGIVDHISAYSDEGNQLTGEEEKQHVKSVAERSLVEANKIGTFLKTGGFEEEQMDIRFRKNDSEYLLMANNQAYGKRITLIQSPSGKWINSTVSNFYETLLEGKDGYYMDKWRTEQMYREEGDYKVYTIMNLDGEYQVESCVLELGEVVEGQRELLAIDGKAFSELINEPTPPVTMGEENSNSEENPIDEETDSDFPTEQ